MIDTLLLSILLTFAASTPKEDGNHFDYSVGSGFEYTLGINSGVFKGGVERENEKRYYGYDIVEKVSLWQRVCLSGAAYQKTVRDIRREELFCGIILSDYVRVGVSAVWDSGVFAPCGNVIFGDKFLKAIFKIYEHGLESMQIDLKYPLKVGKRLKIEPVYHFMRDRSGSEYYKGGVNFVFEIYASYT